MRAELPDALRRHRRQACENAAAWSRLVDDVRTQGAVHRPITNPDNRSRIADRGRGARGIQATGSISGSCRSSTLLRQLRAGGKAQLPSEGPSQAVARRSRAQRRSPRTPSSSQFGSMLHRAPGLTPTIGRRQAFVDRVSRQAWHVIEGVLVVAALAGACANQPPAAPAASPATTPPPAQQPPRPPQTTRTPTPSPRRPGRSEPTPYRMVPTASARSYPPQRHAAPASSPPPTGSPHHPRTSSPPPSARSARRTTPAGAQPGPRRAGAAGRPALCHLRPGRGPQPLPEPLPPRRPGDQGIRRHRLDLDQNAPLRPLTVGSDLGKAAPHSGRPPPTRTEEASSSPSREITAVPGRHACLAVDHGPLWAIGGPSCRR